MPLFRVYYSSVDQEALAGWCDWVESGLICIFIDQRIVNEERVLSYIQAILKHEKIIFIRKNI